MPALTPRTFNFSWKLDERDVWRLCDLTKEEGRFGFYAARLAIAALPLCGEIALLLQPATPADRTRRAYPEPYRRLAARKPCSMASTTRRRRSMERALAMHAGLLRQHAA